MSEPLYLVVADVPGIGPLPLLDGDVLPVFEHEASALFCATVAHRRRPQEVTAISVDERRPVQVQAFAAISGRRAERIPPEEGGTRALEVAQRMLAWLDRALAELASGAQHPYGCGGCCPAAVTPPAASPTASTAPCGPVHRKAASAPKRIAATRVRRAGRCASPRA